MSTPHPPIASPSSIASHSIPYRTASHPESCTHLHPPPSSQGKSFCSNIRGDHHSNNQEPLPFAADLPTTPDHNTQPASIQASFVVLPTHQHLLLLPRGELGYLRRFLLFSPGNLFPRAASDRYTVTLKKSSICCQSLNTTIAQRYRLIRSPSYDY
jgi:hypothetical protein